MWVYKIKMPDCDTWVEICGATFRKYLVSGERQVKRVWVPLYTSQQKPVED